MKLAQLDGTAIFGEIAVLCDHLRSATVEATTHATVIRIERYTFNQVIRDVPQLALALARELARRLELMSERFVRETQS